MKHEFHHPYQGRTRSWGQWISYLVLTPGLCCFTTTNYALTGGAQQAIQALPESSSMEQQAEEQQATVFPPAQPNETKQERLKRIQEWLATPAGKRALQRRINHPYVTNTAPSVFTPAGVPMKWGGIGFAAAGFTGSPIVPHGANLGGGGGTVVLPVGDSDKIIGGAIAVSEFGVQSNSLLPGGSTGDLSFLLSRWLGPSTIATAGVVNVAPWGNVLQEVGKTYYGAVTQQLGLLYKDKMYVMSGSFGIGSGAFAPLGKVASTGELQASLDNNVYPFANLSFNYTPNLAVVGDYYSETFAVGLAYNTALKRLPLNFLLYAGNLRTTATAPSASFGLRVSTGFELPQLRAHQPTDAN